MKKDAEPQFEHRQTELGKTRQEATHSVMVTEPDSSLGKIVPAPAALTVCITRR